MAIRNLALSTILACAGLLGFLALVNNGRAEVLASPPEATAVSTTHYVAPGGDWAGGYPCYATVQAAVDAAVAGDEIRVAAGTYTGTESDVLLVEETVTIRGGYTATNWATADPEMNPTILDGEGARRVIHVAGEITVVLEGLTVTRGFASEGGGILVEDAIVTLERDTIDANQAMVGFMGSAYGGGVSLRDSTVNLIRSAVSGNFLGGSRGGGGGLYAVNSSVNLLNTYVTGNQVFVNGGKSGGLYVRNCDAVHITGSEVTTNSADFGGGLYASGSDVAVTASLVRDNDSFWGGGIYLDGGTADLARDVFKANDAFEDGGGLYLRDVNATLVNTVVIDNVADGRGSGLYSESSSPTLVHATLARNSGQAGSAIHVSGGMPVLTNVVVVGHVVGITVTGTSDVAVHGVLWYSNTQANVAPAGAITVTDAVTGSPGFAGDGYHLTGESAAVDRGVTTDLLMDIDQQPRFGLPDLGADELWLPGLIDRLFLPVVTGNVAAW